MSDLPEAQRQALESWAQDAIQSGFLASHAAEALTNVTIATPDQLFSSTSRPLVAGLFGGTGVGKSTLLNRLAGETIARASAERPTSRDITVYVHDSIVVDKLPENFPIQKVRTAIHHNDRYRNVMFIDMPDFDSVETANRELVDAWLPHLDLVLYVVSPDRYRDDQGWRLLLDHIQQHAWLFIMNHWDRGDPVQLEDFKTQLAAAGMADPLVFRSDCSSSLPQADDDFDDLQSTLIQASERAIIESLDQRGILARLKALKSVSDPWLDSLGTDETHRRVAEHWDRHWERAVTTLKESLGHNSQQLAHHYAESEGGWLSRLLGQSAPQPARPSDITPIDETRLARLDNTLADFLHQQAQSERMPLKAMKHAIAEPYARARRDLPVTITDELERSLAKPGKPWQRAAYTALTWLSVLLPLAAMAWVAWRVVAAFVEGGSNPAAYLGSNFAVNATLLLALAWMIPSFARRKTKPSREKAAQRGLLKGIDIALQTTQQAVTQGLQDLQTQSAALRNRYESLWTTLQQTDAQAMPESLRRMLASELTQPLSRSLDVRANTQSSTDSAPVS